MVCFHSKSTYVDDAWGKCKSLFTKDKQAGLIPTCPKDYVYIYAFISQMLFKKILFIFGCAGSSLLCGVFSSCIEWVLLSGCGVRASPAVASVPAKP